MKLFLVLTLLAFSVQVQSTVINLASQFYEGDLFHNEQATGVICQVKINKVIPNSKKGKHCHDINAQMFFGLNANIHNSDMEILLGSRRTNNSTEFNLPPTCGEVTIDVEKPWEIDRWSDDTTHLYNQAFAGLYKVNHHNNHYFIIFDGKDKTPTRAMIHRVLWLREDSYECRGLEPR